VSGTLLRERFGALTSEEVAALDAAATQCGVDTMKLMEVAGWQVARCAWALLGRHPDKVAVVAGRGNNGGDGLVAGRHLCTWGCSVTAVVVGGEDQLRDLVRHQLTAARGAGVSVTVSVDPAAVRSATAPAALTIDAVLGTGLRSAPRSPDADAIRALQDIRVLSVDVPSGLDAGSGEAFDPCVRAETTCTLTAAKAGLWPARARSFAGRVVVADIGMPASAWRESGLRQPSAIRGGCLLRLPVEQD
jgi:hydroxyethylthiazole kinase-like uncharacterized protein yjeF